LDERLCVKTKTRGRDVEAQCLETKALLLYSSTLCLLSQRLSVVCKHPPRA
jgi:hypothetical protein